METSTFKKCAYVSFVAIVLCMGIAANYFENWVLAYGYNNEVEPATIWGLRAALSGLSVLMLVPLLLLPFDVRVTIVIGIIIFLYAGISAHELSEQFQALEKTDGKIYVHNFSATYPAYRLTVEDYNKSLQDFDELAKETGLLLRKLTEQQIELSNKAIDKAFGYIKEYNGNQE